MPRYKLDPHKVEAKLRKDGSNREEIKHDEFYYQKVFGEKTFTAAGVIRISVGKRKPVKTSKDNAFVSCLSLMASLSSSVRRD